MFRQFLYNLYLRTLSLPLVGGLIIIGWKRNTIRINAQVCGLSYGLGFRIRFYLNLVHDLLIFFHGRYGLAIQSRPRDATKLHLLRVSPTHFLTAHFHNWEHMGAWMTRQGISLLSAARPLMNGKSQALLSNLRTRLGMRIVDEGIPRRALRHLKQGGCFALLWDQRVPGSETRASFFGRTLDMDPLPRFLTRHSGVPVFFGVLLPGGRFRLIQLADPERVSKRKPGNDPALGAGRLSSHSLTDAGSGSPEPAPQGAIAPTDPYRNLGRRYHRVLELLVRAFPTYWYGLAHKRFLDEVTYSSRSHVSRETSGPSEVMVSRETKV
ncbi:MAG: hypothetical protein JWP91_1045 [Fibrobacteres bacterium]|nr:hypothetical protein [Fibrobacterota bacterium]